MIESFQASLEREQRTLPEIEALLGGAGWDVDFQTSMDVQRLGIDALISKAPWRHTVEFKSDFRAKDTGNVFIETVSVDGPNAYATGWAYTCTAQFLGIYLVGLDRLLLVPTIALKSELERLIRDYPTRSARNRDYQSHGVLVPVQRMERLAARVLHL